MKLNTTLYKNDVSFYKTQPIKSKPISKFVKVLLFIFTVTLSFSIQAQDNDGDSYSVSQDCDDNNDKVYPFAPELTDGLDNNCANGADEYALNPLIENTDVSEAEIDVIFELIKAEAEARYPGVTTDAEVEALFENAKNLLSGISLETVPGFGTIDLEQFFAFHNDILYFPASADGLGTELWKTDGTEAGTGPVKDIFPGASSSDPSDLEVYNGEVYFTAKSSGSDTELWKTDGTDAGTVQVKDINVSGGSNPNQKFVHNGQLYFVANDGSGNGVWKTDGTNAGTSLVKAGFAPRSFISFNGELYFADLTPAAGFKYAIWKTNGTPAGTVNIDPTANLFLDPVSFNGALYFSGGDSEEELWTSDGTAVGTVMLKDINTVSGESSYPRNLIVYNNAIYFKANDGVYGNELWTSDGTAAGTVLLADIYPGGEDYPIVADYTPFNSNPSFFTEIEGSLYFVAEDANTGNVWALGDTVDLVATWTGLVDSDWENVANWEYLFAPGLDPIYDVVIPSGRPNYPILTDGQDLSIDSVSSLTVDSGASITVSPNAVVSNDGTVTNNGTITFKSDATGSAYIGSGSGTYNGDVVIERFIPARRAFRFVSSPVTTDDYISNNWQLATHITGSTSGANGFDITNTGNPSMYSYNNVSQAWNAIPNTDATNLESGVPYRLFVRGDRTVDLTDNFATPSPTTLMATGVLTAENTAPGPLTLNATAGGFSFVGNPFQAQVDMGTVLGSATNVNNIFYWVWDPNLGIRGAYATVFVPSGTATAGVQNQYLQAGQSCFVKTNAASAASLAFDQASKNTSDTETNVFRPSGKSKSANTASTGQVNLKLYESSAFAANQTPADGLWIFFDDAGNNDVDGFDAVDFTNLDENFSSNNNGTLLSIENRATPTVSDEIQLEINTYRATDYVLEATATALQGDTPMLVDTYLNQTTELLQNGTTTYAYSIDTNIPASFAGDRFKIIFESALSVSNRDLNDIVLYPNPSNSGNFYLNIPQGVDDLEVTIYNALGAQVYHTKDLTTGNKVLVNASFIKNDGVYFVKLSSEGSSNTKKLIIN